MKKAFTNTIAGSLIKVFVAACLAMFISNGKDIFSYDETMWKSLIGAGVSAVVLTGYNFLNKNDPRYGIKKTKESEIVKKDG